MNDVFIFDDKYKITKKHFNMYKESTYKWLNEFQINDYRVCFVLEDNDDDYARVNWDDADKICVFSISKEWDMKPTEKSICKVAFHEVWELILGGLRRLAEDRYVEEREILIANHSIIRRLENTVFEKYYKDLI